MNEAGREIAAGRDDTLMRLLAALLMPCLVVFPAHAATLSLDGSRWSVLYSRNCPASPSTVTVKGKTAWRLRIEGTCQPHYVLRPANDKVRAILKEPVSWLALTMQIANARLKSVQDGGTDTYATVMLQRRDDDLSGQGKYAHYRQWAFRHRIKLIDGTFTVTIPMDRTIWTGVNNNVNLIGPNLYDLVITANITGGGPQGRLEKQGAGGLKLTGANSGLVGTNEVQTLSVPNNVSRFTINFGGFTSDVINFLDANLVVQQKLEAVPGIGAGNILVGSTIVGTQKNYTLTFQNALGGLDVPTATMQVVSTGVSEVQRLTFANNPGGTFTLSYGNFVTPPITYIDNEVQLIRRLIDGNIQFGFNGVNSAIINLTAATTAAMRSTSTWPTKSTSRVSTTPESITPRRAIVTDNSRTSSSSRSFQTSAPCSSPSESISTAARSMPVSGRPLCVAVVFFGLVWICAGALIYSYAVYPALMFVLAAGRQTLRDIHFILRRRAPGTDAALACAMMHVMFKEGFADRGGLRFHAASVAIATAISLGKTLILVYALNRAVGMLVAAPLAGAALGSPFDGYAERVRTSGPQVLGEAALPARLHLGEAGLDLGATRFEGPMCGAPAEELHNKCDCQEGSSDHRPLP